MCSYCRLDKSEVLGILYKPIPIHPQPDSLSVISTTYHSANVLCSARDLGLWACCPCVWNVQATIPHWWNVYFPGKTQPSIAAEPPMGMGTAFFSVFRQHFVHISITGLDTNCNHLFSCWTVRIESVCVCVCALSPCPCPVIHHSCEQKENKWLDE